MPEDSGLQRSQIAKRCQIYVRLFDMIINIINFSPPLVEIISKHWFLRGLLVGLREPRGFGKGVTRTTVPIDYYQ